MSDKNAEREPFYRDGQSTPEGLIIRPRNSASPAHLIADVEVIVPSGLLAGMVVNGVAIMRGDDERPFVQFPYRTYQKGGRTYFWEFIRGTNIRAARAAVLAAYAAEMDRRRAREEGAT